jgi:hypothetical protein
MPLLILSLALTPVLRELFLLHTAPLQPQPMILQLILLSLPTMGTTVEPLVDNSLVVVVVVMVVVVMTHLLPLMPQVLPLEEPLLPWKTLLTWIRREMTVLLIQIRSNTILLS